MAGKTEETFVNEHELFRREAIEAEQRKPLKLPFSKQPTSEAVDCAYEVILSASEAIVHASEALKSAVLKSMSVSDSGVGIAASLNSFNPPLEQSAMESATEAMESAIEAIGSAVKAIKSISVTDPGIAPSSIPNLSHDLSLEQRFQMVRSVGEECIQEDELLKLLAKKAEPVCYDGFEPSGRMHIAQGVMKTINVNKLTSAGCRVKILIADEFAKLNNKMGGDLKKIEMIGRYFIEIWKAVGMDLEGGKVEFVWSSKEINARSNEYWFLVSDIAQKFNLKRISRCTKIMGRSEHDELTAAQILYPCMQCADVFFLKVDICQLGMDQRKVNVLAREYCDVIKRKNKPIILSHHMLPGLNQGQEKMSKSDPSSSIFMEDNEAEVNVKIKKAFCPPRIVDGNPCLEYIKYLIFPWFNEFTVERNADNGGSRTFKAYEDLVAEYASGELHPGDLKPALSKSLNKILEPVRVHFKKDSNAKELLKRVKAYKVTK